MISLTLSEKVMIGTALLGGMAGVVGSFAVLRRRSLVGDMLAHAALPGICLAFLVMHSRDFLGLSLGALASGLLGVGLVTIMIRWTRTKEDAAIGIVLSTFFGLGVVLLSKIQDPAIGGNKAGLDSFLFGEPGNMLNRDLVLLAIVAAAMLLLVALLFKEFKLVCFDSDFAQSQGWPTLRLDLTMMAALAVVTIVGLPIVGVVLMAAMIIMPAATARFWTNRLHLLVMLACALGVTAGVVGTKLGHALPAGAAIVLTAAAMFLISLLLGLQRGVVWSALAEFRLRRRMANEHLLRSLYELSEPRLPDLDLLSIDQLRSDRHWRPWALERLLHKAEQGGLIDREKSSVRLTPLGLHRSATLTKTHRLWEMYLMQHANIAPDHVDRDADDVEHLLPESLLLELERQLAAEGRLPQIVDEVPESPHELPSTSGSAEGDRA